MNAQHNNFLDNDPAIHPRLVDSPQQHSTSSPFVGAFALGPRASDWNTLQLHLDDAKYHQHHTSQPHLDDAFAQTHNNTSLFGGAVALDPCASNSATPQLHLDHATFQHNASNTSSNTSHIHPPQNLLNEMQQARFNEAFQPPLSTQENPNDVTTWRIDEIREVAMYFDENPERLALFDLQDQWLPKNDSDDDDEEGGAYGGLNLEHDPRPADPADTNNAHPSSGSCGHTWIYELPPQSDPELERRRRRALRQRQQREKQQRKLQQLESDLQEKRRVVEALRRETSWLQQELQMLS